MRVKVHGGTVTHGEPSLCYTCRYATIVKGTTRKHEIIDPRSDPKHKDIGFVRSRDLRPRERVYFDED